MPIRKSLKSQARLYIKFKLSINLSNNQAGSELYLNSFKTKCHLQQLMRKDEMKTHTKLLLTLVYSVISHTLAQVPFQIGSDKDCVVIIVGDASNNNTEGNSFKHFIKNNLNYYFQFTYGILNIWRIKFWFILMKLMEKPLNLNLKFQFLGLGKHMEQQQFNTHLYIGMILTFKFVSVNVATKIAKDPMGSSKDLLLRHCHQAASKAQQAAAPKAQQVAAPKAQQAAAPKAQQVAAPKAQQVAAPKAQQVAAPKAKQAAPKAK